jgi:hypothetical protein
MNNICILLRAAAQRGAAAVGHLLCCRSSTMSSHRLRRGASHLPDRRSRQNVNVIHLQALTPHFQVQILGAPPLNLHHRWTKLPSLALPNKLSTKATECLQIRNLLKSLSREDKMIQPLNLGNRFGSSIPDVRKMAFPDGSLLYNRKRIRRLDKGADLLILDLGFSAYIGIQDWQRG